MGQTVVFRYDTKNVNDKKKIEKLNFIKTEIFLAANNIIKKVKKQLSEWENICKPYIQ